MESHSHGDHFRKANVLQVHSTSIAIPSESQGINPEVVTLTDNFQNRSERWSKDSAHCTAQRDAPSQHDKWTNCNTGWFSSLQGLAQRLLEKIQQPVRKCWSSTAIGEYSHVVLHYFCEPSIFQQAASEPRRCLHSSLMCHSAINMICIFPILCLCSPIAIILHLTERHHDDCDDCREKEGPNISSHEELKNSYSNLEIV